MEVKLDQGLMDISHGWNEKLGGVVWVNENFIANGNGFDLRGRVVSDDVFLNPSSGKVRVFGS
jgi:hypothetical protein